MESKSFLMDIDDEKYFVFSSDGWAVLTFFNAPSSLNFMEDILNFLAAEKILIDMISMTPPCSETVKIAISLKDSEIVKAALVISKLQKERRFLRPVISIGNVKITIKSNDMENSCGIAARAFTALIRQNSEVYLITTSKNEISFLMPSASADEALLAIKKYFRIV